VTVLGHVQRGGTATAFDRVLGSRFGQKAVELVRNKQFGKMVALRGTDIIAIPIEEAVSKLKTVDPAFYESAKMFLS
jgi:6-phosphofructokinase 1